MGVLPVAHAVADPDHSARSHVAAELVGEVGNVVQVELGTDEEVLFQINLDTYPGQNRFYSKKRGQKPLLFFTFPIGESWICSPLGKMGPYVPPE